MAIRGGGCILTLTAVLHTLLKDKSSAYLQFEVESVLHSFTDPLTALLLLFMSLKNILS